MMQIKDIITDQQLKYCNQCGKCSSGCPSQRFLDFSPRRIVIMAQIGLVDDLLSSDTIWLCAECLKCKERCPREVAPYDVIQALRNLAFKTGLHCPIGYSQQLKSILNNGLMQESQMVRGRSGKRVNRKSLGLPELQKPYLLEKLSQNLSKITQLKKVKK